MTKLRDVLNVKVNSCNKQISLDIKKTKLKELDFDVEDILNMRLRK